MKNLPVVVAFVNDIDVNIDIFFIYDKFIVDNQQMTMIFDTNVEKVIVKNVVDNQSFVLSFEHCDFLMTYDHVENVYKSQNKYHFNNFHVVVDKTPFLIENQTFDKMFNTLKHNM